MITQSGSLFVLSTSDSTYCFRIMETGQLEHIYYGKKITLADTADAFIEKHAFAQSNTIAYDSSANTFSLEDACLEFSAYGKGDIREPFIELVNSDGSRSSDFVFEKAEITQGKKPFKSLPGSYDEDDAVGHLCVTLKDKNYGHVIELHYFVYENCGVITRSARFINGDEKDVRLLRLMSTQLDYDSGEYVFTTFTGEWAREMNRTDTRLCAGKQVNASYTGTSSSRANPFVMLSKKETAESYGSCYGFNLIYSGNHYECAEVNGFGKTRFVSGINPQGFCFIIAPGEDFEAPEAIMTFSADGFNGMSQNMHAFIREHIVRGEWKHKERPILLNSWEAAYFDITENKLTALAKAGESVGIELFVMDDGWFGKRDNDKSSLGDWTPNRKKLPHGLGGVCKKINDLGLDFGIWVEPEMVNTDSNLYRDHPDWVLAIPGKPHAEGRNQRILDLTNPVVQDYIIEQMSAVFASANIRYVKWDMNRIFSDYYAPHLNADRQGETAHRYVIGLYHCLKTLTEQFPHILFEGCAAGGNRFDPGILCYFPQIWASDDTDAACRSTIQTGYSYGYPPSTFSAHVSASPNHQTLRITPLETRFNTACFAVCGYECNLCDMKKEDLATVKAQIALYKEWRAVFQFGSFYRGRSGNTTEWTAVSPDKKRAVGFIMHKLVSPNVQYEYYKAVGLDPEIIYNFYNRILKYDIRGFGDLINTITPIHIKQDSLTHNIIANFMKMDGETEDYHVYGDALMNCGIRLRQAYAGTGYNDQVRFFQDFASRIYFMEAEEN